MGLFCESCGNEGLLYYCGNCDKMLCTDNLCTKPMFCLRKIKEEFRHHNNKKTRCIYIIGIMCNWRVGGKYCHSVIAENGGCARTAWHEF
jgi:hypothetical protein